MTSVPGRAWAAVVVTILIWASFLVVTRAAMTSLLSVTEVGLIRYGVGALFFLPVLMKKGLWPRDLPAWKVFAIPVFGGALFLGFLGQGLKIAPVADSGVFTPSMLPLFVALLSTLFLGERIGPLRLAGFAMILVGALAVGGYEAVRGGGDGVWVGHVLFLCASFSWAIYTVIFRASNLGAFHGGALLCFYSALAFCIPALIVGTDFASVPPSTLAIQILFQGVLSGFVATWTFFYAVTALGPSRTAAFAALVPVLAALGGWVFLGEPIGPLKALGILIVSAGVLLASGAVARRQRV